MVLVAYSDSEDSADETASAPQTAPSSKPAAKQSFQKVVDSSNPRKIKVNLPSAATTHIDDPPNDSERPAKRARTGGSGLFSGLSSFLPAPKRSGDTASDVAEKPSVPLEKEQVSRTAVNLKTGAAPAFSRETASSVADQEPARNHGPVIATTVDADEVQLVGKVTMFRPLSVARKTQKKKKSTVLHSTSNESNVKASTSTKSATVPEAPKTKPKVSLFSLQSSDSEILPGTGGTDKGVAEEINEEIEIAEYENAQDFPKAYDQTSNQSNDQQSLNNIASDLNLDEATRRQLFGRKGNGDGVPINLLNFNTDQEYAANEKLRESGETIQHNPLRTIQPGKHSLRQLVNAAVTQKDALEESWAAGRRNQREAGGRYGW
jgi:Mitotic checkpoint regulator, MAD2B-interacting